MNAQNKKRFKAVGKFWYKNMSLWNIINYEGGDALIANDQ